MVAITVPVRNLVTVEKDNEDECTATTTIKIRLRQDS